jgi:hypothetical protein
MMFYACRHRFLTVGWRTHGKNNEPMVFWVFSVLIRTLSLSPPPLYISIWSLTFATPTLLAGDRSLADVIAHEIAHSWTGNLVTNATWEHFWLNEVRLYSYYELDYAYDLMPPVVHMNIGMDGVAWEEYYGHVCDTSFRLALSTYTSMNLYI